MDNPEISATLGARHRIKTNKTNKNTTLKTKKINNTDPTKNTTLKTKKINNTDPTNNTTLKTKKINNTDPTKIHSSSFIGSMYVVS